MSDESNQIAIDAMSILEADLTNVETTFPLIQPGIVDFVISDAKMEPTSKGNGYMLNLTLKTTIPVTTTKGELKAPGFPFRKGIFIPSGNDVNPDAVAMAKQKLAQLKESAFGDKSGKFGEVAQYIGRTISARLTVVPDSRDKSVMQNDIAAFVKRNQ